MPIFQDIKDLEYLLSSESYDDLQSLLSYAAFDVGPSHIMSFGKSKWWIEYINGFESRTNAMKVDLEGPVAILDNTTLHNAVHLMDPDFEIAELGASHILDLATFMYAFVFCENLIFLRPDSGVENRTRALFGSSVPVKPVEWKGRDPHNRVFDHLWSGAERFSSSFYRDPDWAESQRAFLSKVTGLDLSVDDAKWPATRYRRYFSSIESMAVSKSILGESSQDSSVHSRVGFSKIAYDFGLTQEFVVETAMRTIWYLMLGNVMDVDYYPSSYRSNLRKLIAREYESGASEHLSNISRFLEPRIQRVLASDDLQTNRVPVPFILSAVLRKANAMKDVPSLLADVRAMAEPLRRKRAELEHEISVGNLAAIERIGKAIKEDAISLAKEIQFLENSISGNIILNLGGTRSVFGALGHLLVSFSKLPDEVKDLLKARLVRPEFWVLTNLASEAIQCANVLDHLLLLLQAKNFHPDQSDLKGIRAGFALLFSP